jgi:hypothetical protein
MYETGVGDSDLRATIAAVDEKIKAQGSNRAAKSERRDLIRSIAASAMALQTPPAGAEVEYGHVGQTQTALVAHHQMMGNALKALPPDSSAGWRRVLFGYAAISCILILPLVFVSRVQEPDQGYAAGSNDVPVPDSQRAKDDRDASEDVVPAKRTNQEAVQKAENIVSPNTDEPNQVPPSMQNIVKQHATDELAQEPVKAAKTDAPLEKPIFLPVDIKRVATVSSSRIFHQESLLFPKWGNHTYHNVPFMVVDPQGGETKNTICLYSRLGAVSSEMPRAVYLPCDSPAKAIHFLGASGWGFPSSAKGTVSMQVKLEYADGPKEVHSLLNGVHLTDWAQGSDVPESKNIGVRQVRYFSILPKRFDALIRGIEFHKGTDQTSPFVIGVTIETSATQVVRAKDRSEKQETIAVAKQAKREAAEKKKAVEIAERERQAALANKGAGKPQANLLGSVWAGKEGLDGYGVLKVEFGGNGKATMTDAKETTTGKWRQEEDNVTITFYEGSVIYSGRMVFGGYRISGVAKKGNTDWTWDVKLVSQRPDAEVAEIAEQDRREALVAAAKQAEKEKVAAAISSLENGVEDKESLAVLEKGAEKWRAVLDVKMVQKMAADKKARPIEIRIETATKKNLKLLDFMIDAHNSNLADAKAYVTTSEIIIQFRVRIVGEPLDSALCHPLLISIYDKNGLLLTRITSKEVFTPYNNTFGNWDSNYSGGGYAWEPKLLERWTNTLSYRVNARDIRDAAIVEVGFIDPR